MRDVRTGSCELKFTQKLPAEQPGHGLITNTYLSQADYDLLATSGNNDLIRQILMRLTVDHDLTVRSAAHGTDNRAKLPVSATPAKHWSCQWCGQENPLVQENCVGCALGSRPRLPSPAIVDSEG